MTGGHAEAVLAGARGRCVHPQPAGGRSRGRYVNQPVRICVHAACAQPAIRHAIYMCLPSEVRASPHHLLVGKDVLLRQESLHDLAHFRSSGRQLVDEAGGNRQRQQHDCCLQQPEAPQLQQHHHQHVHTRDQHACNASGRWCCHPAFCWRLQVRVPIACAVTELLHIAGVMPHCIGTGLGAMRHTHLPTAAGPPAG